MISKGKRRSDAGEREESQTRGGVIGFRRIAEGGGLRTPLISESRTKSVESPAPRLTCGGKTVGSGHVGVGKVIKYLHARDACMRDDVSKVVHACGESDGHLSGAGSGGMSGVLARSFFRVFTCVAFALFILLSMLSLGTLLESRYSKLVEVSELIGSVSVPSVEDIYYFSRESKESVREAFNYLSGGSLGGRSGRKEREESYSGFFSDRHGPSEATSVAERDEKVASGEEEFADGSTQRREARTEGERRGLAELTGQVRLTGLVEMVLGESRMGGSGHSDGTSLGVLELLCYKDFGFQEGMLGMYYREREGEAVSFGDYLVELAEEREGARLVGRLSRGEEGGRRRRRVLDLLGLERPYELYILPQRGLGGYDGSPLPMGERRWLFRVSRRVVISSGYGNEEIRRFCELGDRWVCTKHEMLVLRLLLEYYRGGETFMSFFLCQYKAKIVDRKLLDSIPFFTKSQARLADRLFPGLFESFQRLTRDVYAKIDGYEQRRGAEKGLSPPPEEQKYHLEKVTEEDVNWIISLVLSHSLQDRDGNIAFVPYSSIIPHSSVRTDQTVLHHPSESSFDWGFSQGVDRSQERREDYVRIRSFYGHLNNVKSIIQYGRLLDKNEYTTVWFIRRGGKENEEERRRSHGFRVLYGTRAVLDRMDSQTYREHLPDWLLDLSDSRGSKVRVDAKGGGQFVHYISKTKTVPIARSREEAKLKYIDCNEHTFYNGVGLGFGTVQFAKSSPVGGIRGSVYVCLREIIPFGRGSSGEEDREERREQAMARFMHDNCRRRSEELRDVRDFLVSRLGPKLGEEVREEDLTELPAGAKQEIRIDVKLLYATLEELRSMRECTAYFGRLLRMISEAR